VEVKDSSGYHEAIFAIPTASSFGDLNSCVYWIYLFSFYIFTFAEPAIALPLAL